MRITPEKLPRGLKLTCDRHGGDLKYHKGSYMCMDDFDGSTCASITLYKPLRTKERE